MSDESDEHIESIDCVPLAAADGARVVITRTVAPDFQGLDDRQQARFIRIMEMWCSNMRLTIEMFNANEGRSPNFNLLIQAFKGFKLRFYGFVTSIGEKKTFVIVDKDLEKKRNKADAGILERAKGRADGAMRKLSDFEKRKIK